MKIKLIAIAMFVVMTVVGVMVVGVLDINHTPKLDTVWRTWSDDGSHGTCYYGYSSGHRPDSVLHVAGGFRFYKPAGDDYDCFTVPSRMDSIVHVDYYLYRGDQPCRIEAEKTEKVYEKYWAGGDRRGRRKHHVGYKYTGFSPPPGGDDE